MTRDTDANRDLLVALMHPLRRRLLRKIRDEEPRNIGPRGLADALGEPLNLVSHHIRVLLEHGAIELIDVAPSGGAMAHFYRSVVDEPWALAGLESETPLLAVLVHPRRRRILNVMAGVDSISPKQVADRLRAPLSSVGYHVRFCAKNGAVQLVDQQRVRGAAQHFYRRTVEPTWALEVLSLEEKNRAH